MKKINLKVEIFMINLFQDFFIDQFTDMPEMNDQSGCRVHLA